MIKETIKRFREKFWENITEGWGEMSNKKGVYYDIEQFIIEELEKQREEIGNKEWQDYLTETAYNQGAKDTKSLLIKEIEERVNADKIIYCTQHSSNNAYKTCDICALGKKIKDRVLEIVTLLKT